MKTLKDFKFKNKKVLVRVDFNVPLGPQGEILDDFRIRQGIPTIKYLLEQGAEVILMSHLGDPGGKFQKELQMIPITQRLEELLGQKITLLENLRFNPGEEKNDDAFAKELAQKADIYVNDAFGVCHRSHASVAAITKYLPSCAGLLLEEEIKILTELKEHPKKPLVAIIGGAKVETKVGVIEKMSETADFILVSGLIYKGILGQGNMKLLHSKKIVAPVDELSDGKDIGLKTVALFGEKVSKAKTIFWNGPVGKVEDERFREGTKAIAEVIVKSKAFSVVGGGETVEFIQKLGLLQKFNHVSTGGGAMLAFLAGEKLPGIIALN